MSNEAVFSKETLAATAATALTEVNNAKSDLLLVEAWVKANNADAVQEVAEHGQGKARTAARRGLNVLKSRGVAIPPRRKLSAGPQAVAAPVEAVMLPPDGSGTTLFVLSKAHPSGRCAACFVYINDALGVQRLERVDSTVGKIKTALTRGQGGGGKPVTVPVAWARHRIQQARKSHENSRIPEPLGFDSSRDLLEPFAATPPEHPFDTEGFEFADEDAKALSSDSGVLHHLPEFASWLPSQAAITELLRAVGRAIANETPEGESPDQTKVTEFLKAEMLEATDRYFNEEHRTRLTLRMKDAGLAVLAHNGESEALKVAATVQVIERCGLITDPPRDVPFLRAFFEKAISFLMMQQGGQLQIPIPKRAADSATELAATPALELASA
jgi:hypothetical protein